MPDRLAVMSASETAGGDRCVETERLLLRPWRVSEAGVQRELWTERDPRVPPHRRIDADGNPTIADLAATIRAQHQPSPIGLLAVERTAFGDVIGAAGLIEHKGGPASVGDVELAFEFLRRAWGQGYATEAARAVLDWAASHGHQRVWATVWDWNTPSRRVLAKLGFVKVARSEQISLGARNLVMVRRLDRHPGSAAHDRRP
jgi:ribosomal-protein-alanine N-acetyltransferase